jgi:hypothetical protein
MSEKPAAEKGESMFIKIYIADVRRPGDPLNAGSLYDQTIGNNKFLKNLLSILSKTYDRIPSPVAEKSKLNDAGPIYMIYDLKAYAIISPNKAGVREFLGKYLDKPSKKAVNKMVNLWDIYNRNTSVMVYTKTNGLTLRINPAMYPKNMHMQLSMGYSRLNTDMPETKEITRRVKNKMTGSMRIYTSYIPHFIRILINCTKGYLDTVTKITTDENDNTTNKFEKQLFKQMRNFISDARVSTSRGSVDGQTILIENIAKQCSHCGHCRDGPNGSHCRDGPNGWQSQPRSPNSGSAAGGGGGPAEPIDKLINVVEHATEKVERVTEAKPECATRNKTLKRCSKCKITSYCSRECQAKDWKIHKKACKFAIECVENCVNIMNGIITVFNTKKSALNNFVSELD